MLPAAVATLRTTTGVPAALTELTVIVRLSAGVEPPTDAPGIVIVSLST